MIDTLDKRIAEPAHRLRCRGRLAGPPWLQIHPRAGRARARGQTGFPTTRQEEWRFTNMAPLLAIALARRRQNGRAGFRPRTSSRSVSACDGYCLVFVDGAFRADLSSLPAKRRRLQAGSLRARLRRRCALNCRSTSPATPITTTNFFTALNTAFFQDGAFISVADGVTVEQPVHLLYLAASEQARRDRPCAQFDRGGHGSSAFKVVETYASLTDAPHVTNAVTELVLGPEARVEHCKLQNENEQRLSHRHGAGRAGQGQPLAFPLHRHRRAPGPQPDSNAA